MQTQINLLPPHLRPKPQVRFWPILLATVLTLNLLFISTYWLTLQLELSGANNALHTMQNDVANLQRRVQDAQWKADLAQTVTDKTDYINIVDGDSILWHPGLLAIQRALVPEVTLDSISSGNTGDISLSGDSDTIKSVADFLGSLQAETGLEIVRFHNATPGGGFSITLTGWQGRVVEEDE